MAVLSECRPERVFYYFEQICQIPHGSGNTREISDYLAAFAREHDLDYVQDEWNNIVIYKPAFPGYEQAEPVILQGHMDMVCEKAPGVEHDFERDPLELEVDGNYVRAKGTTLGGDDGIAVAYALALLEAGDIPHPALEVLITVDEEIGLLGADHFDASVLRGRRLINLDSEEEGILLTGCAGGMSAVCTIPVKYRNTSGKVYEVRISGLLGGHSGTEIDKNRGNAHLLLGRLLYGLKKEMRLDIASLEGGQKDNVIPRECVCELVIQPEDKAKFQELLGNLQEDLRKEYAGTDEGITVSWKFLEEASEVGVLHPVSCEKVIFYLMNIPNGVQKMSGNIPGLVETSLNLGILSLEDEVLYAVASIRSSVNSAKKAVAEKVEYLTEFLGGDFERQGEYPAWEYRENSPLRDLMAEAYRKVYGKEPVIQAIHAGLECGLFYEKIPELDCISMGPDILDIHTPQERLDIASTQRVWEYLLKVLASLR